ncbi:hypothetical protein CJU72_22350 [Pseudomonas fragi]|nr:hypothetical protein CJU72_22350 [Pseudomonas fragi]
MGFLRAECNACLARWKAQPEFRFAAPDYPFQASTKQAERAGVRMEARRAETWLVTARFTTALRQRRHATTAAQLQIF